MIKVRVTRLLLSVALSFLTFLTDLIFGTPQTAPIEEFLISSTILIWLVIFTLKRIDFGVKGKNANFYFILAIAIGAIINYSAILSEALPHFYAITNSITNVISYSLYSIGFYTLIKE